MTSARTPYVLPRPMLGRVGALFVLLACLGWSAVASAKPLSGRVTERVVDSAVDTALEALSRPENLARLGAVLSSSAITGGARDIAVSVVDGVFDAVGPRLAASIGPIPWSSLDRAARKHVAPAVAAITRGAVDAALQAALSEDSGVRIEAFAAHATHGVIKGLAQGLREDLGPALAKVIEHDLAPAGAAALELHVMPAIARGLTTPEMQAAIATTMAAVARNLVRGGDAGIETAKLQAEAQGKEGSAKVFGDSLSLGLNVAIGVALAVVGTLVLLAVLLLRSSRGQQRIAAQSRLRELELLAVVEQLGDPDTKVDRSALRDLVTRRSAARPEPGKDAPEGR